MVAPTSPLRYPGGKSCMLELVSTVLRLNAIERGHYAEPYAGGCGLALSLLFGGHVADIHINDIDPSIWAFWYCALNETDAFVERVQTTPVSVREWRKQRAIHHEQDLSDPLSLGFSAFFLNRTNRSGVIKGAGVIGGLAQKGPYKIGCRFNRDDLSRRIDRISKYKDRIHLSHSDAMKFLRKCEKRLPHSSLLFIDPPYYSKGASLYTNFYKRDDHATVASRIIETERNWIVTYDDSPEIRRLYRNRRQYCFDIDYSLHQRRIGTELLVASKGIRMPEAVRARQINKSR